MVLAGLALLVAVPDFLADFPNVLSLLLRDLSRLVGFVLLYVGLMALLYKIIADATATT